MTAREDAGRVYQSYVDREVERILTELEDVRLSLSNEEGQVGGVAPVVLPSAPVERGESREGSLRITEVPERFHRSAESKGNTPHACSAVKSVEYFGHAPEPDQADLVQSMVYTYNGGSVGGFVRK